LPAILKCEIFMFFIFIIEDGKYKLRACPLMNNFGFSLNFLVEQTGDDGFIGFFIMSLLY
jgi:hypothetical protein